MCIYVYVCIWVYVDAYICTYICMYVNTYVSLLFFNLTTECLLWSNISKRSQKHYNRKTPSSQLWSSPNVYLSLQVYTLRCIYVYMYLWIYVYICTCIFVYMYTCIHVYMYICIRVWFFWWPFLNIQDNQSKFRVPLWFATGASCSRAVQSEKSFSAEILASKSPLLISTTVFRVVKNKQDLQIALCVTGLFPNCISTENLTYYFPACSKNTTGSRLPDYKFVFSIIVPNCKYSCTWHR